MFPLYLQQLVNLKGENSSMHTAMKKYKQRTGPTFITNLQRRIARALHHERMGELGEFRNLINELLVEADSQRFSKEANYLIGLNIKVGRKMRAISQRQTAAFLAWLLARVTMSHTGRR